MSDLADRAVDLLTEASREEMAFSEWLGGVLAKTIARRGGWQHLERAPSTWQASLIWQLIMRAAVMAAVEELADEASHRE